MEKTKAGLLVNFEGTDRSGKDTQLLRVAEQLREAGLKVTGISIPDRPKDGQTLSVIHQSTGDLLNRVLRDRLALCDGRDQILKRREFAVFEELLGDQIGTADAHRDIEDFKAKLAADVHAKLLQTLFSINRRETIFSDGGMNELLAKFDVVLTGRYLSAYVYGPATGVGRTQISLLEGDLPQPDLNFLFDIDPAIARARRAEDVADVYEADSEMQARVRANYAEITRRDAEEAAENGSDPRWVRIDATLPMDQITEVVVSAVIARTSRE